MSSEVRSSASNIAKETDSGEPLPKNINGVLRAKVTDAESGQAISNIVVSVVPVSREQRSASGKPNSNLALETDDGGFFIDDLAPGIWSMRVRSEGYSEFVISRIEIVASQMTRELKIPMKRGNRLSGHVFRAKTGMPTPRS